jgi:ABC-type multidrug transport system fused ATPase/permease subunit
MNLINKIYQVFTDQQKKEFKILVFYSFLTMILETFSISLIIPLLNNILNNDNALFIKIIEKIPFSKFINNENIFFFLITFFFIIFLFKSIFLIYYTLFKNKFIYSIRSSLSNRMFSNILKVDYSYHVQNNSSKIINALTREVEEMVSLIDSGITFFTELLIVIGLFMLIIFYEPINLLAIIFLFIIALTIYQVTKKKFLFGDLLDNSMKQIEYCMLIRALME